MQKRSLEFYKSLRYKFHCYCLQRSTSPRTITLLQYQDWSSQSCPKNPVDIVDLIEELECVQRKTGNNAIAVHCRYEDVLH